MSACSGEGCQCGSHAPKQQAVALKEVPNEPGFHDATIPSVPAVPKVEGIKVKFMLGQALTICECGNANQLKFARYINRMPKIDERGRQVKHKEIFIMCLGKIRGIKCGRTRPIKEQIENYNQVMKGK